MAPRADALWALARRLALGLAVGAMGLVCILGATAVAADQTLQLDVIINGYRTEKIGEFILRDGALYARPQELTDLGVRVRADPPLTQDGWLALSALSGLTARLDPAAQTLYVQAAPEQLLATVIRVRRSAAGGAPLQSSAGATLNYDAIGSTANGRSVGGGLFDLRVFAPWGVASTSMLGSAGAAPRGASSNSAVRLDSNYVYSDYSGQLSYRLGDVINGGLAWTRPVRLGGVQAAHDFSMRPDLVTFPLPALAGAVAVPSSLEVLVNGAPYVSRQIPPGPFEIPQLPVVNGVGTVAMTVTDALGRQVATTLPFYASSRLLAQGLQIYSLEAGFVRRRWGVISNDYADFGASATLRRGLSSNFTIEAHAEGGGGASMAGAGLAANVRNQAVLSLAAAGSTEAGRTGGQLFVGAERIGRIVSFGLSTSFAGGKFRDLAAVNGDSVPLRQISASAGVALHRLGGFSLAYGAVDRGRLAGRGDGPFVNLPEPVPLAQHAHILSASYSVQAGRVSIFATGYRDFTARGGSGVSVGFTLPLGSRGSTSAIVNAQSTTYGEIQAERTPVRVGEWGYLAFAAAGGGADHEFAQALYKSPWALVSAGVDQFQGVTTFRAEAQGALTLADGRVFASNAIQDSFAIVDTHGVGGIRVSDENRVVGRTDSSGRLLVPDLRSFEVNHLSIDPTDAPVDVAMTDPDREVRPSYRSGVVVSFPIRRVKAALLILVDDSGTPLPPGSAAVVRGSGARASVGYDGQAYVEGLESHNLLTVELPAGKTCAARFDYRPSPGEMPKIGPLTCKAAAP